MANSSILAAFERMWQHVTSALNNKSDISHTHDNATQESGGMMSVNDKINLDNAVLITEQVLTDEQKAQARANVGVVQADLSINDESDPAYVHGRTHWVSDPVETVFLEETSIVFDDSDIWWTYLYYDYQLTVGDTYKVILDNAEYERVVSYNEYEEPYIGNLAVYDYDYPENTGTNEPFYISNDSTGLWCNIYGADAHTISIYKISKEDNSEMAVLVETDISPTRDYICCDYREHSSKLVEGNVYNVALNGVVYECVAKLDSYGDTYIGNQQIGIDYDGFDFPEDIVSDEPFFICTSDAYDEISVMIRGTGTYTISIIGMIPEIHKLPMKYLPDGYPYMGEPTEEILLDETSFEISSADERVGFSTLYSIERYYTYAVVFDGVRYECAAYKNNNNYCYIGNAALISENGGADEPFLIICDYTDIQIIVSDIGSHTVSISEVISGVYKISDNYLPDGAKIGVEGNNNTDEIFNDYRNNVARGSYSHAEGLQTTAIGQGAHAEGLETTASGHYSHAEGRKTTAIGQSAHAEGYKTMTNGDYSHAEGRETTASGYASHAEGRETTASGYYSHAEGRGSIASEDQSHAEGYFTVASSERSHAEGNGSIASGSDSHAEGAYTTASGEKSHSEGYNTKASGYGSHAEGVYAEARGYGSHAEGCDTIARGTYSHVQGRYNIEDTSNKYAHIVGNGTSPESPRSNAHTLDWDGVGWFAGGLKVGGTSQDDANAKNVMVNGDKEIILASSTEGSTKQFKLTIDDDGVLTVSEIV
mgnify:CR=1 FL=1